MSGGLFGRLATIFKARMDRAIDSLEDPAEVLDYSYQRQVETLQQVRRGIADVATARARVQGQLARLGAQTARLDTQARQALTLGREDLARTALTRKIGLAEQARLLGAQAAGLEAQQQRLLDGETRLAARIEAFRMHKEVLKARYSAAQAQVRLHEAVSGLSQEMGDARSAVRRAHDKTEQMQARATALDALAEHTGWSGIGPDTRDDIERELARLDAGNAVETQLEEMKRTLADRTPERPHLERLNPEETRD